VPDAEEGAQATGEEPLDSEVGDATKPVRKKKSKKPSVMSPGDTVPNAEESAQTTEEEPLDSEVSDATEPVRKKKSKKPPVTSPGVTVPDAVLESIPTTDDIQNPSPTVDRGAAFEDDRQDPNAYLSSFLSNVGAAKEKSSTEGKSTAATPRPIASEQNRPPVNPRVSAFLLTLKAAGGKSSDVGWGGVSPEIRPASDRNRTVMPPKFLGGSVVRKIPVSPDEKDSLKGMEGPS
jgi:hypothetical protein